MTKPDNTDHGYTVLASRLETAARTLQSHPKFARSGFIDDLLKAITILKRFATRSPSPIAQRTGSTAFDMTDIEKRHRPSVVNKRLDLAIPPKSKSGIGLLGVVAILVAMVCLFVAGAAAFQRLMPSPHRQAPVETPAEAPISLQ